MVVIHRGGKCGKREKREKRKMMEKKEKRERRERREKPTQIKCGQRRATYITYEYVQCTYLLATCLTVKLANWQGCSNWLTSY